MELMVGLEPTRPFRETAYKAVAVATEPHQRYSICFTEKYKWSKVYLNFTSIISRLAQ